MIAEADGVVRSNSYPRKYPSSSPFFPSTPWTIDLTDEQGRFWIAVFDLDAKRTDDFEQAAEDLGVLIRTLRAQGLPHVVCRSSPTGGFHVFLAVDGVDKTVMARLAAAARAVLPSLDHGLLCNDRTGAVRPPLSPHAKGGASAVMEAIRLPVHPGDLRHGPRAAHRRAAAAAPHRRPDHTGSDRACLPHAPGAP
jgi:hypothetical protein